MRLLAWFLGALIGGGIGAFVADLFNATGFVELLIIVVFGLGLAALAEGLVKNRQNRTSGA